MKPKNAIEVTHLFKVFPLRHARKDENGNEVHEHWVLKDISFEVKKGERREYWYYWFKHIIKLENGIIQKISNATASLVTYTENFMTTKHKTIEVLEENTLKKDFRKLNIYDELKLFSLEIVQGSNDLFILKKAF